MNIAKNLVPVTVLGLLLSNVALGGITCKDHEKDANKYPISMDCSGRDTTGFIIRDCKWESTRASLGGYLITCRCTKQSLAVQSVTKTTYRCRDKEEPVKFTFGVKELGHPF